MFTVYDSPLAVVMLHMNAKTNLNPNHNPNLKPNGATINKETSINQSINQSMAVTDAGTKVPLYPYHTFYTLLVFKST